MPGLEGRYSISNLGRVRNDARGTIRKTGTATPSGHQHLIFWADHTKIKVWIHRAVLEAFVGPAPEGQVARHLNGNPRDNRLANLSWGTRKENSRDRILHGRAPRGEVNVHAKLTNAQVLEIFALRGSGRSGRSVGAQFGVTGANVSCIWSGKSWGWLTGA